MHLVNCEATFTWGRPIAYIGTEQTVHLLRVVGLVVAEPSLLLQDLVHLGGVRGGAVAAAGGGGGHGQNGGEHKLKTTMVRQSV